MHEDADPQDTELRTLVLAPLLGLDTTCHELPSHTITNV